MQPSRPHASRGESSFILSSFGGVAAAGHRPRCQAIDRYWLVIGALSHPSLSGQAPRLALGALIKLEKPLNRTLQLGMIGALALGLLAIGPLEAHARGGKPRASAELGLVHGIAGEDGFPVDILVVNRFRTLRLDDVTFGTAANVGDIEPGFIRPGFVWVGVFPPDTFGNGKRRWKRNRPILSQFVFLKPDAHQTVIAYVEADETGGPIGPAIEAIPTDRSPLRRLARVTANHRAVAPKVSVCANGALDLTDGGFVNGETASADVLAQSYDVTITAPGDCDTVLAGPIPVDLPADVNTLAFAIGEFPESFQIVPLQVPVEQAVTIFATGQLLTPGDPAIPPGEPGHDDTRENFVYAIDPMTGIATPVSPATTGLPSALAGDGPSRLLGFTNGQLVEIEPTTGAQTPIGANNGLRATGLDVTDDGWGFLLPFNDDFDTQQLHELDLETGDATPIGSPTAVGDAIDEAAGNAPGTSRPFVIGLGSVGDAIYGVDLDTDSLIEIDPIGGSVEVIGDVGAVGSVGGGAFSGFAAMTGVDEDADGHFDALFGNVNFFDDDGDPETPTVRLGGVARYDLDDGTWSLVGTNPGVIFFGFASNPAPESDRDDDDDDDEEEDDEEDEEDDD